MIIEKNRHLNELIKLFDSLKPVTATELASFTNASIRTIKNDMKYLNEELKASEGCEIYAHKGKGYSIIIKNKEKVQKLQYKLKALCTLFERDSIVHVNRQLSTRF